MGNGRVTPLYIGLATRDGQAQITTLLELWMLGQELKRPVQLLVGEAGNIPRSRNKVMEELRKGVGDQGTAWVLWVDSDIIVPTGGHRVMAEAIRWSEATHMAWAANYRMGDGDNVLMRDRTGQGSHHFTPEELAELPAWSEIGMSGFGCCYLPMDVSYVFHADVLGEDVHFFLDHPELRLYYAKAISLKHKKTVAL